MQIDDATLLLYLRNFRDGFDTETQRRRLRKRGWIEYTHKSWSCTEAGRKKLTEAAKR